MKAIRYCVDGALEFCSYTQVVALRCNKNRFCGTKLIRYVVYYFRKRYVGSGSKFCFLHLVQFLRSHVYFLFSVYFLNFLV